jgi:hypothetical protein
VKGRLAALRILLHDQLRFVMAVLGMVLAVTLMLAKGW